MKIREAIRVGPASKAARVRAFLLKKPDEVFRLYELKLQFPELDLTASHLQGMGAGWSSLAVSLRGAKKFHFYGCPEAIVAYKKEAAKHEDKNGR